MQATRVSYARRVVGTPFRYQSPDEDSARWLGFPFRDSDIVISTRSKTGTTWVQMICGLLIFQKPELPAPLAQLSPWLDHLIMPRDQVYAELAAQRHRRFIKTHTPLDGIPFDPRVKDNAAFFRRGTSGAGREILDTRELAAYHARVAQLAPPDLLAWLHSPRTNSV
jgi:hypothetical protein